MIQLRKKDYLQRIIEEFFNRLQYLKNDSDDTLKEKNEIVADCFNFFYSHLDVRQNDNLIELIRKIGDIDLLEQYAKLLLTKYEVVDIKDISTLRTALDIVLYIESADKTFSWNRTILKEDLLRLLSIS